jgi:putative ABC transport system permease protein
VSDADRPRPGTPRRAGRAFPPGRRPSAGAALRAPVLLLAAAIAALLPVLATAFTAIGPALRPSWALAPAAVPPDGIVQSASRFAGSVDAVQSEALATLLGFLAGILAAAMAAAAVTLLAVWAHRGLGARGSVAVRRALGQSPGAARRAAARAALAVSALGLALGGVGGWAAAAGLAHALPGALARVGQAPSPILAAAVGAIVGLLASSLGVLPTVPGDRRVARLLTVGDRVTEDPALGFARRAVASAQVAVLVVATGTILLLGRSVLGPEREAWTAQQASDTVIARVSVDDVGEADLAGLHGHVTSLLERATGARAVTVSSPGALLGLASRDYVTTYCGACIVGGLYTELISVHARRLAVSPNFFAVHGGAVAEGRSFASADAFDAPGVVMLGASYAYRFDDREPVGKRVMASATDPAWSAVIGVAPDLPEGGFAGGGNPLPTLYLATTQALPATFDVAFRGTPDAATIRASTLAALRANLPQGARIAVGEPRALETLMADLEAPLRWMAALVGSAALPAFLLALLGMAAGMREEIRARRWELGIRAALGATPARLARAVVLRGIAIGARGLVAGLVLFLAVDITLRDRAPAVRGATAADFALLATLVLVVCLATTVAPALCMSRSDPAATLWKRAA